MRIKSIARIVTIGVLSLSLVACGSWTRHRVHHSMVDNTRTAPKKVVVLPVDVRVYEMSVAGSIDEMGDWTAEANANAAESVRELATETGKFEVYDMSNLTQEELDLLNEYVALYDRIQSNIRFLGGDVWRDKYEHFDYSVGEGLGFLKEKTGADAAILVSGQDVVSSSGRKAAIVFAAVVGVGLQAGHAYISTGVIDLEQGDLLWFDNDYSGTTGLREKGEVKGMLGGLMENYPGIDEYRKATGK